MGLVKSLPDVPRMQDPGLYELLQAMRRMTVDSATKIAAAEGAIEEIDDGGGGGTPIPPRDYERDPPSFILDYDGDVDPTAALADYDAATAKDVYVRDGEYTTSRVYTGFVKPMHGPGLFVLSDRAIPAKYGYMATKPETWAVQGLSGWFRGDQSFTDGGEYKILGPLVRTYDINARYFESNTIPHHAWWEVESGNSGTQAYCSNGVTPGNTVTLAQNGTQEWVGKTVQIKNGFGGPVVATLVVQSVAGPVVTFTTSHAVNMPWTVPTSMPALSFAPRTWAGFRYLLVRARGGGDIYGDIVRMNIEYQPKSSELVHSFNGMTGGQYGGSIDFTTVSVTLSAAASTGSPNITVTPALNPGQIAFAVGKRMFIRAYTEGPPIDNRTIVSVTGSTIVMSAPPSQPHPAGYIVEIGSDGCYCTGWESQYNDQGSDVAVIAQVDSFVRLNDRADQGGRAWLGTLFKSEARAADAAHVVAGYWRRGLDTVNANLVDSTYTIDPANAGATTLALKWTSGVRIGHLFNLQKGMFQATITSIAGNIIAFTPALNANYPANTLVDFSDGGAAVAMRLGQWINWDASSSQNGRSADPLGIWGPLYGNQTGIIWSGTSSDGGGTYWQTQHGEARIRLRPTSFTSSVTLQSGQGIVAALELSTLDSNLDPSFQGAVVFGSGTGEYITFNSSTGRYEFYINDVLAHSIP